MLISEASVSQKHGIRFFFNGKRIALNGFEYAIH